MDNDSKKTISINCGKIVFSNTNAAIMQIIIVLLAFFTILTPKDEMGFKKLFLCLALIFGIGPILRGLCKSIIITTFAVILPVTMYIISTVNTESPSLAINYLYPFAYLFLVFPIVRWNIDIHKIMIRMGNIMIAVILVSCFLDFIGVMNIYSNPLLMWLNTNGEAQISTSNYAMFWYVLFFKASPIMFFNLTHYIEKNNKICMLLSFVAILFTGTRANIFLSVIIIVFGIIFLSKKNGAKVITIIGIIAVIFLGGAELLARYHVLMFAKYAGDLTRIGGMSSILDVLNSNELYWLVGMGFGSTYYNVGKLGMVETSELSYLEFIREIGLPFSIVTFSYLLYPLFKLKKIDKFMMVAFGAYLIAGITEPFIFTSTGFFVMMMVYSVVLRRSIAKVI